MIDITTLQRFIPASVKNVMKPYYRKLLPNELCINFMVTFRCNYRCSYCPWVTKHDYSKIYKKEKEPSAEEWIIALDKLPRANIYISGGEPFSYQGLPEIVNRLKKHRILGIVTNASMNIKTYQRVKKKVHLNLSFHREFVNEDQFFKKIENLGKLKTFHININLVGIRENLKIIPKLKRFFDGHNVSLHIDPFIDPDLEFEYTDDEKSLLSNYLTPDRIKKMDMLNFESYEPKLCTAGQNYINLMPDGNVFRCVGGSEYYHSPLKGKILFKGPKAPYNSDYFLMGNIFDSDFKLEEKAINCDLPCTAACDRDMANIKWLKNY